MAIAMVYLLQSGAGDPLVPSAIYPPGQDSWAQRLVGDSRFFATHDAVDAIGELWWDRKWGARGKLYRRSPDEGGPMTPQTQWSVDLQRRLFSMTDKTYLALGIGWDEMSTAGDSGTSGPRFIAEGRLGYGVAYLFGEAAYTPWLLGAGPLEESSARGLELGVAIDPFPSFSLKAGYRGYWRDGGDAPSDHGPGSRNGLFLGGGWNW